MIGRNANNENMNAFNAVTLTLISLPSFNTLSFCMYDITADISGILSFNSQRVGIIKCIHELF